MWACDSCSTVYANDLTSCPHCGVGDRIEAGEIVPKNTRYGGASNATTEAPEAAEVGQDVAVGAEAASAVGSSGDDGAAGDGEVVEVPAAPDEDLPDRPLDSASKAEWLVYAQSFDDPVDLSTMTKADLIARYG